MTNWKRINRRDFTKTAGGLLVALASPAIIGRAAQAQSAGELTVMISGGTFADGNTEAYVKPFEAATGIKVNAVREQVSLAKMKLAVESGSVDFDVCYMSGQATEIANHNGFLTPIDYSLFDAEELSGLPESGKKPFAVGSFHYAFILAINNELYKGKTPPKSWADFWDVENFPGSRVLHTGDDGVNGPWEFALLADGVPIDQLYPLDVERAYRSLDKIKPHIRKWWRVGSEAEQLFHDKVAHIGENYEGRANILRDQGHPIDIEWNQGKLVASYWSIPKGAPNAENAQKFLAFAIRGEQQAILARMTGTAPSNARAMDHLTEEEARKLATYPENRAKMFEISSEWYAEVGSDGRSNIEKMAEGWQEWILT